MAGAGAGGDQTNSGPSAKFIKDVNFADRTPVEGGAVLIKRWELQNDGSVAWPSGSKLIFTRGDRELVDQEEFPVTEAAPGATVEVSAVLRTPTIPGRYQAFFRLADSERNTFGQRIWCDLMVQPENKPEPVVSTPVVVVQPIVDPTPNAVLVKPTVDPVAAPAVVLVKPLIEESSSSSSVAAPAPTGQYATELGLLEGMGFRNRELNTFLLESKQGDLVAVANWLLEKMR